MLLVPSLWYAAAAGKGGGPGLFGPQLPLLMMAVGVVAVGAGVVGTVRSRVEGRVPRGPGAIREDSAVSLCSRGADAAALAALAASLIGIAAATFFVVFPRLVGSLVGSGPCDSDPTTACFAAHSDFYHYDPIAGSATTPASRLNDILTPVAFWAAGLLALAGGLLGGIALALRTRRGGTALVGLSLGSLIVAGMVGWYLLSLLGGGGE